MTDRDTFLLRTNPRILEALRRWARDELRSVNSQIEYILHHALVEAGRLPDRNSDKERPISISSRDQD